MKIDEALKTVKKYGDAIGRASWGPALVLIYGRSGVLIYAARFAGGGWLEIPSVRLTPADLQGDDWETRNAR